MILNSANVRQDLIDIVNGDGMVEMDDMTALARTLLNWMTENECREMVDKVPEFMEGEMFGHLPTMCRWIEEEEEEDEDE